MKNILSGHLAPLFVILILSIFSVLPIVNQGFFPVHDNTQVERVYAMAQALKDGQFPVRTVDGLGYNFGYPLFNFYAPLAFFSAGFLSFFVGILMATKMMFVVGLVSSGFTMYLLAQKFWGKTGGVISGLFYIYAPYHAVDVYVRGAVGEFWAMVFLPLIFYGLTEIYNRKKWGSLIASVGYAGVILSHNLTAMMIFPFVCLAIIAVLFYSKSKKQAGKELLLFAALSLGLSVFYWLPAYSEMALTKVNGQVGGGADFRDHFIFLDQLWVSAWGYGGSSPGRSDGMSFIIGKAHLLFVLLSLIVVIKNKCTRLQKKGIIGGFVIVVLAICLTNEISRPVWELAPPMSYIQYPWRFLTVVVLAGAFLSGSAVLLLNRIYIKLCFATIGLLLLLGTNLKYFQPSSNIAVSDQTISRTENIAWTVSKISDEYLPTDFTSPSSLNEIGWGKIILTGNKTDLIKSETNSIRQSFLISAEAESVAVLNTAYFPWWQVSVNGNKLLPNIDSGRMSVTLSPGQNQLDIVYASTNIQKISNILSLLSWGAFLSILLKRTGKLQPLSLG